MVFHALCIAHMAARFLPSLISKLIGRKSTETTKKHKKSDEAYHMFYVTFDILYKIFLLFSGFVSSCRHVSFVYPDSILAERRMSQPSTPDRIGWKKIRTAGHSYLKALKICGWEIIIMMSPALFMFRFILSLCYDIYFFHLCAIQMISSSPQFTTTKI